MQLQRVPGEPPPPGELAAEQLARQGVIVLTGELSSDTAAVVAARAIAIAADRPGEPITVRLNGVTGSVAAALMLHDVLKSCATDVTVVGAGSLDTAGAIVLAAGTVRKVTRTARIHLTRVTEPSLPGLDVERAADDVAAQRSSAEAILGRSLDTSELLSAEEAVASGLADTIS